MTVVNVQSQNDLEKSWFLYNNYPIITGTDWLVKPRLKSHKYK